MQLVPSRDSTAGDKFVFLELCGFQDFIFVCFQNIWKGFKKMPIPNQSEYGVEGTNANSTSEDICTEKTRLLSKKAF